MPVAALYDQVRQLLQTHIGDGLNETSLERLVVLVCGIIGAKSASPARIAKVLHILGLSAAKTDSIERRVRRIENDPQITSVVCLHPLARSRLVLGRPQELLLVLDPTTQDDRVVMVSASVWYRGRALPLAWMTWPGNTPLKEECFWTRIESLLDEVATVLPVGVEVTWLADRTFGCPAFTDLVVARGWHYVVRVQDQTRCQDRMGREHQVRQLVKYPRQRAKLTGLVFKGQGWRQASVLVFWGRHYKGPLCLVTDLGPRWAWVVLYRRRYGIEAAFRDYKTSGWRWEQGQVKALEHLNRLLVGMAIATWIALSAGSQVAAELLARPSSGKRRTRPYEAKQSLFGLGLDRLHEILSGVSQTELTWQLDHWQAPNWSQELCAHHVRAFLAA